MIEDSCSAKLVFSRQADTCGVNLGGTLTNFHNFPFRQTPAKFTYHRFWTFAFVPCWYTTRYIDVNSSFTQRELDSGAVSLQCIQLRKTNYFYVELVTVLLGIMALATRSTWAVSTLRRWDICLSCTETLELEADKSSYSSVKYRKLRAVSTFEALATAVILFSLTASVAANDSFKDLTSLHRASTCCLSDWFCCLKEAIVSLGVLIKSIEVK